MMTTHTSPGAIEASTVVAGWSRAAGKSAVARHRLLILIGMAWAALAALAAGVPGAEAVSPDVVISQVYGGGGNSGALYTHDFVELFNRGTTAVSLAGWSIQYASAEGTGNFGAAANLITELPAVSLAPGQYLLVQEAQGTGGTTPLPAPDVSDGTPIAMSATGGKVALVNSTTPLGCNGGSTPCSPAALAMIVDLVGYGSANFFEGTGPTPAPGNTTAVLRSGGGCVDTDDNAGDFAAGPPAPRNTASPLRPCGAQACGQPATLIHDIQGPGLSSPLAGTANVVIEGVVVGQYQSGGLNGFFVQEEDADADANPLTSEGIFVFTTSVPVSVGALVRITGDVAEFNSLTELTNVSSVVICASGVSVTPTTIGLPVGTMADLERYEGMLVTFPQELTVTDNFRLGRFGEVDLAAGGRLFNPTSLVSPGAPALALQDLNDRSRIVLDDGNGQQNIDPTLYPAGGLSAGNTLRIGDTVSGLIGILDQRFGAYRIQPVGPVAFTAANPRPPAPDAVVGSLKVAALSAMNYFTTLDTGPAICGPSGDQVCRGADSAVEFTRQRDKIISALLGLNADVVGVTELENNATASLQDLVNGLNAVAGAGIYGFVDTGTIGGDAIKVGVIYKPASVTPVGPHAVLDSTVDPLFDDIRNRPVLAQTFDQVANGQRFTVAVAHLKSKGTDCNDVGDPDLGDGQGNCNLTRTAATTALVDWLATDPTGSGDPDFLIVGDLNSYAREDPVTAMASAGYTNVVESFVGTEAYSFVFQGQSGALNHALSSPGLTTHVTGATLWHINADEPAVLDYNVEFKSANHVNTLYDPGPYRASDLDPVLVGLCQPPSLSVSASPSALFPPNHKYVTVKVTVAASADVAAVSLVSATSNEPDNGLGDGDTSNDIVIVDGRTLKLRAERSGRGSGRVYTLTYEATSGCGSRATAVAKVTVPHSAAR